MNQPVEKSQENEKDDAFYQFVMEELKKDDLDNENNEQLDVDILESSIKINDQILNYLTSSLKKSNYLGELIKQMKDDPNY